MATIGKRNTLTVLRDSSPGIYLDGGEHGEILLPNRYVPPGDRAGRPARSVRLPGFGGSAGGHHRNPARHSWGGGHLKSHQYQPPDRRLFRLGAGQGFIVALPRADRSEEHT